MNCGTGALSPLNYANSVIGRAWTLMSINFGEAKPGETFMASTGHNLNYNNMTFAENEEDSPFAPFHVGKGFGPQENTVSIFRGWDVLGLGLGKSDKMAEVLKNLPSMAPTGTFVMDPLVAKSLKDEGFTDKEELRAFFAEQTGRPPQMLHFIVVGDQMNPLWITTDFVYTETESIDKWIPKAGIKKDEEPLRMPSAVVCKDGICNLPV